MQERYIRNLSGLSHFAHKSHDYMNMPETLWELIRSVVFEIIPNPALHGAWSFCLTLILSFSLSLSLALNLLVFFSPSFSQPLSPSLLLNLSLSHPLLNLFLFPLT